MTKEQDKRVRGGPKKDPTVIRAKPGQVGSGGKKDPTVQRPKGQKVGDGGKKDPSVYKPRGNCYPPVWLGIEAPSENRFVYEHDPDEWDPCPNLKVSFDTKGTHGLNRLQVNCILQALLYACSNPHVEGCSLEGFLPVARVANCDGTTLAGRKGHPEDLCFKLLRADRIRFRAGKEGSCEGGANGVWGYVEPKDYGAGQGDIFICEPFYLDSIEGQIWTLFHELLHVLGADEQAASRMVNQSVELEDMCWRSP